ncbi:Uncharacterised protein [Mycobacteroides abscessus subsp. abscessus]|nr:Uncharacterised protein [Mycobacteroides abscessus subsp. abscessus]
MGELCERVGRLVLAVAQLGEQCGGRTVVEQRAAPSDGAYGRDEVMAEDLLEHEAGRPREYRGEECVVVGVTGEHEASDLGFGGTHVAAQFDAVAVGEPDVEDRDVGLGGEDAHAALADRCGLADHLDVVGRAEQVTETSTHQLVVVDEEDAHPRLVRRGVRRRGI